MMVQVLQQTTGTTTDHQPRMMKTPLQLRKRKSSKGTIAGFVFGKDGTGGGSQEPVVELNENASQAALPANAAVAGSAAAAVPNHHHHPPQHSSGGDGSSPGPSKPCHSARLALLCAQNAIRMGARTQLNLCPPGRSRRELQTVLRQRPRSSSNASNNKHHHYHHPNSSSSASSSGAVAAARRFASGVDPGGYYGLDKMVGPEALDEYDMLEEDMLVGTTTFDVDSDEEASSGDEDELLAVDEFFSEESPPLDDDERYANLREPLYTPVGTNPNGPPGSSVNTSGKLPFNRRKIRYFDAVTASESSLARSYVRIEIRRSKRRSGVALARHLRRVQREERRRKRLERGESTEEMSDSDRETPEERELLEGGVSRLAVPVTPAISAALLIESLSINPMESLEGMGRCYDEIVAAGVALLDAQLDPTTPPNPEEKPRPTKSEIMATLEPLLITSLEQPSGDTILSLARLRKMCGTVRYQRRFVQRIAPCLIRPPRAAIWCLRHHNDMEAILAAAELIFDSAIDIFSKGWHERGLLLLADTKRAETLSNAATQLRNLSADPSECMSLGLSAHSNNRRRLISAAKKKKDVAGAGSEALAEWEVIAVDRQIRISISSVLSTDWSRPIAQADAPRPHYSRSRSSKRPATLPQSTSAESPKSNIPSSPRSPVRSGIYGKGGPHSPPQLASGTTPTGSTEQPENAFSSAFGSQGLPERADSPPPPGMLPSSPPSRQQPKVKEPELKPPAEDNSAKPFAVSTPPPMSPKSPVRSQIDAVRNSEQPPSLTPLSPKRSTVGSKDLVGLPSGSVSTPLSPSSVGTTGSGEIVSYKPVTNASTASSSSGATAHYRMLTSTAAERKRTVAACRALRAQIQRFEDAFIQLHGRAPKGQSERAPLATTYAQYREWKRAIRADAACRIQALFRGWKLRRSNDPRIVRIVMMRVGRAGYIGSDVMNHISIPVEIGQSADDPRGAPLPSSNAVADEVNVGQPLAPHWIRPRRPENGDAGVGGEGQVPTSRQYPPQGSPKAEQPTVSLSELQARKRDLKQQLKQYDMTFARRHGRMPVKAEKEPIRHLYESYNSLKNQISVMERDMRHLPSTPMQSPSPSPSLSSVFSVSPSSSGTSAPDTVHNVEEAAATAPLPAAKPTKRKGLKSVSPPVGAPTTPPPGAPSQDLAALKAEKGQLHQMLRSYEKDFFKEHNRQVSSFADIKPVASQYRRYKEIKKAIAALQQQQQQQQQQQGGGGEK